MKAEPHTWRDWFFFCLVDGVSAKLVATGVLLLPLFVALWNLETKSKPGGRAPRLRLTLLLAQKSKHKRANAALGMSGALR